jgi:hypothetical protein
MHINAVHIFTNSFTNHMSSSEQDSATNVGRNLDFEGRAGPLNMMTIRLTRVDYQSTDPLIRSYTHCRH